MLLQMLDLIATGQVKIQRELAQRLGVPERLVIEMINQLVNMGYLEAAVMCADRCAGCAAVVACGPDRHLRLWSLTEKGRDVAEASG